MQTATLSINTNKITQRLPTHWLGGNEVNSSYNMLKMATEVCQEHGLDKLL